MRPRWKVVAALAIVGFNAISVLTARSASEPKYEGKPLSYWLDIFDHPNQQPKALHSKATTAMNEFGTNAYPLLIDWLRYDPSIIEGPLKDWSWIPFGLRMPLTKGVDQGKQRQREAFNYFYWMKQYHWMKLEKAEPAILLLSNIVISARPGSDAAKYAVSILPNLGSKGLANLISLTTNTNIRADCRAGCFSCLDTYADFVGPEDPRRLKLLPPDDQMRVNQALLQCTKDPDETFRLNAIQHLPGAMLTNSALLQYTTEANQILRLNTIPALAPKLLTNSPASN